VAVDGGDGDGDGTLVAITAFVTAAVATDGSSGDGWQHSDDRWQHSVATAAVARWQQSGSDGGGSR
jgi:hypothetical protein